MSNNFDDLDDRDNLSPDADQKHSDAAPASGSYAERDYWGQDGDGDGPGGSAFSEATPLEFDAGAQAYRDEGDQEDLSASQAQATAVPEKGKPNVAILLLAGVLGLGLTGGVGFFGYSKFMKKSSAPEDVVAVAPAVFAAPPASAAAGAAGDVFGANPGQQGGGQVGALAGAQDASQGIFGASPAVGAVDAAKLGDQVPDVTMAAPSAPASTAAPVETVIASSAASSAASGATQAPASSMRFEPAPQSKVAEEAAENSGKLKRASLSAAKEAQAAAAVKPEAGVGKPAQQVKAAQKDQNLAQNTVQKQVQKQKPQKAVVAKAKPSASASKVAQRGAGKDKSRQASAAAQGVEVVYPELRLMGVYPLSGKHAQAWLQNANKVTSVVRAGDVIDGVRIIEVVAEKRLVKTSLGTLNANGFSK